MPRPRGSADAMLRISLSTHAKQQMQRRSITVEEIRSALTNSHTTYPGTNLKGDTVVVVGTCPGGRDLCVVVAEEDRSFVVTTYWKEDS
jgi:hypothetical protein